MINFCFWDIPALLVLIAVVVVYGVRRRNLKKNMEESIEKNEQ